jgi:hypothetical protein
MAIGIGLRVKQLARFRGVGYMHWLENLTLPL